MMKLQQMHEMARHLRADARDAVLPGYAEIMLHLAEELAHANRLKQGCCQVK